MSVATEECPQCGFENTEQFRRCPTCRFPLVLVAGKYKLEKELAQGGMGQVYLARHVRLDYDTERVVKVIKPEMFKDTGMKKRFRREVQVTAALSQRNEHIVRIYDDFGEEKGLGYYYVMEFLQGIPLKELMPKEEGLPLATVLHIGYQICKGLNVAHRQKIVHRDLKPDNIFLIEREGQSFVKVIDFGIARDEDSSTKMTQGVLGTPLYMSPEQADGDEVGAQSDQYSLAIILYEMISANNPYGMYGDALQGQSALVMLTAHLTKEPVPLSQWCPELGALSNVFQRAFQKEPALRYPTLDDFWNAIAKAAPSELQLPTLGQATAEHTLFQSSGLPSGEVFMAETEAASHIRDLPSGALGELEETSSTPQNALLWWIVLVLTCGLFGSAAFLFREQLGFRSTASPPPPVRQPDLRRKRPASLRPVVRLGAPAQRRNVPGQRKAPPIRRNVVKEPVHTKVSARRRTLRAKPRGVRRIRRRRIRRIAPRRVKPVALYRSGPCGANSATHRWIWTHMSKPRKGRVQIVGCSACKVKRRSNVFCLYVPKSKKKIRVQISAGGYQTCRYRLRTSLRKVKWSLNITDPDALSDDRYNCTR